MLTITDILIILTLGSIGGFISGLLGVGGGIIYIPILDYFLYKMGLHDDALVKGILANSLFTIIFSGSVASYHQYKSGNFYPKEIANTAIPGVISALLLTWFIRNGSWYSRDVFRMVFASMLLVIASRLFLKKTNSNSGVDNPVSLLWSYRLTGMFAGFITALSGLGGGVIMTPVFTDILKQSFKKSSSISNGVIPLFAFCVGLYSLSGSDAIRVHQWQVGYIILPVVVPLILATFIATPAGVRMSHKTNPTVLRYIFASFVSLIFFKTLYEIFFH